MDLFLQLGGDPLVHVCVPPLPPLAGEGDGDEDGVDGHRRGRRQQGDPGQGRHQQGQGVGASASLIKSPIIVKASNAWWVGVRKYLRFLLIDCMNIIQSM